MSREPAVYKMDLRRLGDPRAQGASEWFQAVHQKHRLKQVYIVIQISSLLSERVGDVGDIQYLASAGGQDSRQVLKDPSLTYATDVEHVP